MTFRDLVIAVAVALIADFIADWSSHLSKWLVRLAARRLHLDIADRYEEEWLEALMTRPRLIQLAFAADLFRAVFFINRVHRQRLGANRHRSLYFPGYKWRRVFDVFFSAAVLLLTWPAFFAIVIAIKLSSPGPVVFKQRRHTLSGQEILLYKFRTMEVLDDSVAGHKSVRNVTPVGHFLRRTSLDELPQLINVLQGRLSLVGPRPSVLAHKRANSKGNRRP